MTRFLPASKRADLAVDFERLKQTLGMSCMDYDMEFIRLSHYAIAHLVASAALRVERFVRGLVNPLFTALAPQINKTTYAEAVNVALLIELGKMERRSPRK